MSETAAGLAKTPHLYLIDGSGFIFRAYHAIRPLSRADGTPVNAVYGFSSMLFKLMEDLAGPDEPSHLAVIFDHARETFRSEIYPEYKAHRPPAPEDLVPQFPLVRAATEAFGVPAIDKEGFEADDIIATYARQASAKGWKVTIVSSDKDLMQLVDDNISMFDAMKNKRTDSDGVVEKFGVRPDRVVDVQALAGDSVDNVPGVPGIGIKTAAQLIDEYGDLDSLLARAGEIKQPKRRENLIEHADMARISRQLVTLRDDVELGPGLDDLAVRDPDVPNLLEFVGEQQFRSLKAKLEAAYAHVVGDCDQLSADVTQPEKNYQCVTTPDQLSTWLKKLDKAAVFALDTETTSLRVREADLVGICLSVGTGDACYIPVGHTGGADMLAEKPVQLPKADVLAALRPYFENPAKLKVLHNAKYDISILANEGLGITSYDDTMMMSYALDAGKHSHGMDELCGIHLDITTVSFKEIAGTGKNQKTFDQIDLDVATKYAAEDADLTLRLWRLLKLRLADEGVAKVYERLDRPLAQVVSTMERYGVRVDDAKLRQLSQSFASNMETLEAEIHQLAGEAFNINSPKQLGEILFDKMALKGGKRSKKTGAWSTNVDVLEALAAEGLELPAKVLEYRSFAKLKSTYTDALVRDINPRTGRVHTSFHLASTTTGRLSSNDPNLQNIPIRTDSGRQLRHAFIAADGYRLLAADYSQVELRLLAHIAGIESLKQAFADGMDIHAMTASQVFGIPIDGMDPMMRRRAKAINFGVIYGISAFGLARQLGIERGEAQRFIDAYFERFPGIRTYMDETIVTAKERGFVETIFGRRIHVNGINDKNGQMRSFAERAAINAPIQGSAADIIRRAMSAMPRALVDAGLPDVRMLLQVHDELVFEVPAGQGDDAARVIKATMEGAAAPALELSVPLSVDADMGSNWGDAH